MKISSMVKSSFSFQLWPGACLCLQQQFTIVIRHGGASTSAISSAAFINNHSFYTYTYSCLLLLELQQQLPALLH